MFGAVVLVLLAAIGAGAMYGLWRLLSGVEKRAEEVETRSAAPAKVVPRSEVREKAGPDGLVYLCAHDFVPSGAPRNLTNVRRRAYAPLTGEELEPRRLAEQMLYAVIVSLADGQLLELRVAECEPSFMPPFPNKRWTLRVVRTDRLRGCPLAEALDCAFDVVEQRVAKRGGNVKDGLPLDELVEDMLKVARQEMSFWERAGVYADIRQYVEAALIDQGYLIPAPRDTWLEKLRHLRPSVNEETVDYVQQEAGKLAERLRRFQGKHGSATAIETKSVPGGRVEEVDQQLAEAGPPFDEMPLHDCLRLSIHESLLAIRQLEPSEDVGV